jgi:hypothetical protein
MNPPKVSFSAKGQLSLLKEIHVQADAVPIRNHTGFLSVVVIPDADIL